MTMYTDNYGSQSVIGGTLTQAVPDVDATYPIPQGYTVVAQAGLTDNGDGTFTIASASYAGTHVEFTPNSGVGLHVADAAGTTITANTTDQSAL